LQFLGLAPDRKRRAPKDGKPGLSLLKTPSKMPADFSMHVPDPQVGEAPATNPKTTARRAPAGAPGAASRAAIVLSGTSG